MIWLYGNVPSSVWRCTMYRLLKLVYKIEKPGQILTVEQFCEYMQLNVREVNQRLGYDQSRPDLPGKRQAA